MKIVVTGALGHIGSRLIKELPELIPDVNLHLVDNLSTSRYSSLFNLPRSGSYSFFAEDILTADLDCRFRGASAVIHLAAITDAASSFGMRKEVEEINTIGTKRVAEACIRAEAALIFPSTTSVYGSQSNRVDESCPRSELRPQSPYADSKLASEEELVRLARKGLRYTIFRFGTIFGISPGMRFHTAINKFCWQASIGLPLTVWRTALHQVRPYLDLTDCVHAITLILKRDLFNGTLYNVVTENTSVSDIIAKIREHAGELKIEYVDSEIMNQLSYEVSAQRISLEGFRISGDLQTGIAQTMRILSGLTPSRMDSVAMSSAGSDQDDGS